MTLADAIFSLMHLLAVLFAYGACCSQGSEVQQCRPPRRAEGDRDTDSEPDDLDALTRHYQAEAEAAKARAEGTAKRAASQNKGMAERRSDALATPLASDTKCAPLQRTPSPYACRGRSARLPGVAAGASRCWQLWGTVRAWALGGQWSAGPRHSTST